jgi:predicted nuclease with TOPRIM domain
MRLVSGSERDIKETLKAKELDLRPEVELRERITALRPNHSKLGPMFRKDAKEISEALKSITEPDPRVVTQGLEVIMKDGRRIQVGPEYFEASKAITSDKGELEHFSVAGLSVLVYK